MAGTLVPVASAMTTRTSICVCGHSLDDHIIDAHIGGCNNCECTRLKFRVEYEEEHIEPDAGTSIECPSCGEFTGVWDTCPFALEVEYRDEECSCCPTCRYRCGESI